DPGDVHIWFRQTASPSAAVLRAARATLSSDERAHCDRLRQPEDRRDYAFAHHLLRTSLSRYHPVLPVDWEFDANGFGKPCLRPSSALPHPPSFNLSHTRGVVACAIATALPVGVDVERLDRPIDVSGI